mgnify:CR=1 FL=1
MSDERPSVTDSILQFEDLLVYELDYLSFESCTFKQNFGPWKQGQNVDNIVFNFERATVAEYDLAGEKLAEYTISLVCGEKL